MEKRNYYSLVVFVVFVFLLGLSFVSAGIGDWFNSITGRATSGTFTLNITVGNTAPNITMVDRNALSLTPLEGTSAAFVFNFTALDTDGFTNLNFTSAQGRAYLSGEPTTINTTCLNIANYSTNYANFTCTVQLWYFYKGSVNWTINATISDLNGATGENSTVNFTYGSGTALVRS